MPWLPALWFISRIWQRKWQKILLLGKLINAKTRLHSNNLVQLPNNHSTVTLDARRLTQATSEHINCFPWLKYLLSLHWIPRWSFLTYSLCDWILVSLGFMTTQWFDSRWYNLKLTRQQHVIAMVIIRDIHLIKTGWKPLGFWQSRLTLKLITRVSAIQVFFPQTNY